MQKGKYTEQIKDCLNDNPELLPLLRKVIQSVRLRNDFFPKQITVCNADNIDIFKLSRLFSSSAIKHTGNKIIFFPGKMLTSGIIVEEWINDAVDVVGEPNKNKDITNEVDLILGRLGMLFPSLESSLAALQNKRNLIKRKITEDGFEHASIHYQLCLRAVTFLKYNSRLFSPSDLGVEICGDSKAFRAGTSLCELTSLLLATEIECCQESAMTRCGVTDNPTSVIITVFGPFVYYQQGKPFRWIKELWQRGEAATLNSGNLDKIERIELEFDSPLKVISCENESPFNNLMRESTDQALIYTAGFPNSAVKRFISLLTGNFSLLHWGDTDPEGLAIAAILNDIKPLQLYRCNIAACEKHIKNLKSLNENKLKRAQKMLASHHFPFTKELGFTVKNGWLEQEAWILE